jgi:hypothetical protein
LIGSEPKQRSPLPWLIPEKGSRSMLGIDDNSFIIISAAFSSLQGVC